MPDALTPPAATTREQLLEAHRAARHRRDQATLGGDAYKAAVKEIERVEVEIARIERSMEPPKV